MMSKLARKRVVAEVRKTWAGQETSNPELISQKFAMVIAMQMENGFELESWKYQAFNLGGAESENIIAVFVELNPDPRQGL